MDDSKKSELKSKTTKSDKIKDLEIYKVSKETFKEKGIKLKNHYSHIKTNIVSEREQKLKKAKTKIKIKEIKREARADLSRIRYKYALLANALRNQELYRRGILETKIDDAKKSYKTRKRKNTTFDVKKEKKKLNQKITRLRKNYSRPVSTHYRRNRVANIENKADVSHIKVQSALPWVYYSKIAILILLGAVLTTFALDIFYKPFGLYNAGLRGITQIFYYMILTDNPDAPTWYSHALFFGINIPLFVWAWFKVGKKFTIYTFFFLAIQYLISLLFSEVNFYEYLRPLGLNASEIVKERQSEAGLNATYQYGIIFVSALVAAVIYGVGVGLIYKTGGSTGGSKFIMTFVAAKKNKSVGYFATLFGIFVILLGITINLIIFDHQSFTQAFFSPTLLASLLFVFSSNFFLDKTFNRNRKIQLQLITEKKQEFQYFLDYYLMFDHYYTLNKVKKGHWGKTVYKFEMVVQPIDAKQLKNYFLSLDDKAYVLETEINKMTGRFFESWFE